MFRKGMAVLTFGVMCMFWWMGIAMYLLGAPTPEEILNIILFEILCTAGCGLFIYLFLK